MLIGKMPRVRLAALPTPLEPAPRITAALGGPNIWLKRDDLTGLGMGGNKARKLEFLMAQALAEGADTVVTSGGPQSNHCRMTAAAGAKLGMHVVLVLMGSKPELATGNLLLDHVFAAEIRWTGDLDWSEIDGILAATCTDLRSTGRNPFLIPIGGATPTGSAGYVNAVLEMSEQMAEAGIAADYLFHATGSTGTQAGLVVGAYALSAGFKVVGVSVLHDEAAVHEGVARLSAQTADLLGAPVPPDEEIIVLDQYVGEGYGIPTPGGMEAIHLLAETEGVLLDPVYTGKAMAGLINQIRVGKIGPGQDVIFLHTGGAPALFAFDEFSRAGTT
jgi:L-cysteate sulfo-lyase